jgi:hypothetical protein
LIFGKCEHIIYTIVTCLPSRLAKTQDVSGGPNETVSKVLRVSHGFN